MDGGDDQIVKWGTIRRNEHIIIPYQEWRPTNRIVLGFDPARTTDNSILAAMNIVEDPVLGLCGDIINCINFVDTATRGKYKLDSNRQVALIRQALIDYNGDNADYEYIDSLNIDAGAGGGGVSAYGDRLLEDWVDSFGIKHRGLIDKNNDVYSGYAKTYRNAVDKLRLISPRAYRTQMVEEFIELMNLGVIRFPYEYNGQDFIRTPKSVKNKSDEEEFEIYNLSNEEKLSLSQIDLMKVEISSIYKFKNPEGTSVRYALPKEKENRMHDDRFYAILLCAHRLYELRRSESLVKRTLNKKTDDLLQIRAPKLRR